MKKNIKIIQQGVVSVAAILATIALVNRALYTDTTMNFILLGGIMFLALGASAYVKEKKA